MRRMKRLLIAVAAVVSLSALGLVTLFGDNIKALFGSSADALSGDALVSARALSVAGLERKRLSALEPEVPGPNRTVATREDALSTFAIVLTSNSSHGAASATVGS